MSKGLRPPFVGYELISVPFEFKGGQKPVTVLMKPSTKVLKEVVFNGKQSEYKRHVREFTKYFLGTTANAASCTIVNIGEVNIGYFESDKVLVATCDKPIIVENQALG